MARIVYQYMMPVHIHEYLLKKHKQFRHKNLSETLNYLIWQLKGLENIKLDDKDEKPKEEKQDLISDLEKKYGIDTND